jgi:uncharacterized damage-inducible protein DinB
MISQGMMKELEHEGGQTKRILERIPIDKFNWKPHEKSREIGQLAIHVAQIPTWTSRILAASEFDIATFKRDIPQISSADDLVKLSAESVQQAMENLQKAGDEDMIAMWTLRMADHVVFSLPRVAAIRSMSMSHLIHHRGQLSVYLRLLDIPVPGIYGPSADEM